jgi:hypothetical protein
MKYMVELAMTGIDNCWCQKSQLTGHPMQPLACRLFIQKVEYTQYVSPYYIIKYYINTWSDH